VNVYVNLCDPYFHFDGPNADPPEAGISLCTRDGEDYADAVPQGWSHQTTDRANALRDRLIARRLRRDRRLLRRARRNLARWMARDGRKPRAVFLEWAAILDKLTRAEIARFLESQSPMARRLQQSTPFLGLLTEREAQQVSRIYEKART
jgi:hypothetical protein